MDDTAKKSSSSSATTTTTSAKRRRIKAAQKASNAICASGNGHGSSGGDSNSESKDSFESILSRIDRAKSRRPTQKTAPVGGGGKKQKQSLFHKKRASNNKKPWVTRVLCWGSGNKGQLGLGDEKIRLGPQWVSSLPSEEDVEEKTETALQYPLMVACGHSMTAVVTSDGGLLVSGSGALGQGSAKAALSSRSFKRISRLRNVKMASLAKEHGAVITSDNGDLYTWGRGGGGRLGHGDQHNAPTPLVVGGLQRHVCERVACGERHTCVVTSEGAVFTFGVGVAGQLGHGDLKDRIHPEQVAALRVCNASAVNVACGVNHTAVVTSVGALYTWGWGENGRLGLGDEEMRDVPCKVEIAAENGYGAAAFITDVACGAGHSVALTSDGAVHTWGWNAFGQLGYALGQGLTTNAFPMLVRDLATQCSGRGDVVTSVAAGFGHSAAVTDNGALFLWGFGEEGQLGTDNDTNLTAPFVHRAFEGVHVVSVALGHCHTAVVVSRVAMNVSHYLDRQKETKRQRELEAAMSVRIQAAARGRAGRRWLARERLLAEEARKIARAAAEAEERRAKREEMDALRRQEEEEERQRRRRLQDKRRRERAEAEADAARRAMAEAEAARLAEEERARLKAEEERARASEAERAALLRRREAEALARRMANGAAARVQAIARGRLQRARFREFLLRRQRSAHENSAALEQQRRERERRKQEEALQRARQRREREEAERRRREAEAKTNGRQQRKPQRSDKQRKNQEKERRRRAAEREQLKKEKEAEKARQREAEELAAYERNAKAEKAEAIRRARLRSRAEKRRRSQQQMQQELEARQPKATEIPEPPAMPAPPLTSEERAEMEHVASQQFANFGEYVRVKREQVTERWCDDEFGGLQAEATAEVLEEPPFEADHSLFEQPSPPRKARFQSVDGWGDQLAKTAGGGGKKQLARFSGRQVRSAADLLKGKSGGSQSRRRGQSHARQRCVGWDAAVAEPERAAAAADQSSLFPSLTGS